LRVHHFSRGRTRSVTLALVALSLSCGLLVTASGDAHASSTTTTTTYPPTVTYKATLVDVQYVKDDRCYWAVGPEWAPYTPQHGGVVGNYSLIWTNGAVNYFPYEKSATKIGKKLFVGYTGGGGPAPCGPADPHQGTRFPSLAVTVTASILYPTPTTTSPTGTITGTIEYYYASGDGFARGASGPTQVTPSRGTMVEILDSSASSCSKKVLSTVYTDDTGLYTSTLSSSQEYVCVKVIAATSSSEIIPYSSSAADSASGGARLTDRADASKVLGPVKMASSGNTTFSWKRASVTDTIDQALDIDNAVVTGANWLSDYGTTPKFLNIIYPYPVHSGISNFNPTKDLGEINEDDAFDWGVLLHEYGHYVATLLGIDNTTPVSSSDHLLAWNMTNHENNVKAEGLAIAWNEGFADFFSQMVQDAMGTSSLGLPDVGATPPTYIDYTPTETISFQLNLPGNTSHAPSLGEDSEVSVARVLWATYSLPVFAGVGGSVAFVKILAHSLTSNPYRTLSGAVSALLADGKATPWVPSTGIETKDAAVPATFHEQTSATEGGAILSSQNVAPTIFSPDVSVSDQSVSLSWTAGQPSKADDRLNFFIVQYFNASWTTLLNEQIVVASTGTTKSGSEVFQTSEKIPSSWKGSVVNAVVVGWNSSTTADLTFRQPESARSGPDPLSGPYISAPVSLKIP
jgi:hypothetical protein